MKRLVILGMLLALVGVDVQGVNMEVRYFVGPVDNSEALQRCKWFGGTLLTIKDEAKELFVEENMQGVPNSALETEDAWIGLYNAASSWTQEHYEWVSDNTALGSFTRWDIGEPNYEDIDKCVRVKRFNSISWRWRTRGCSEKHNFICERVQETATISSGEGSSAIAKPPMIVAFGANQMRQTFQPGNDVSSIAEYTQSETRGSVSTIVSTTYVDQTDNNSSETTPAFTKSYESPNTTPAAITSTAEIVVESSINEDQFETTSTQMKNSILTESQKSPLTTVTTTTLTQKRTIASSTNEDRIDATSNTISNSVFTENYETLLTTSTSITSTLETEFESSSSESQFDTTSTVITNSVFTETYESPLTPSTVVTSTHKKDVESSVIENQSNTASTEITSSGFTESYESPLTTPVAVASNRGSIVDSRTNDDQFGTTSTEITNSDSTVSYESPLTCSTVMTSTRKSAAESKPSTNDGQLEVTSKTISSSEFPERSDSPLTSFTAETSTRVIAVESSTYEDRIDTSSRGSIVTERYESAVAISPAITSTRRVAVESNINEDQSDVTSTTMTSSASCSHPSSTSNPIWRESRSKWGNISYSEDMSKRRCKCGCTQDRANFTTSESPIATLKVDKKSLSKIRRQNTCMTDDRKSSQFIGWIALLTMSSILLCIASTDIRQIVRHAQGREFV